MEKSFLLMCISIFLIAFSVLFQAYFAFIGRPENPSKNAIFKVYYNNCPKNVFIGTSSKEQQLKFYLWPEGCKCQENITFLKINDNDCETK